MIGDHDQADAFDTAPADPEQVARQVHRLRHREGLERAAWGELSVAQRARAVLVAAALLAWWRRSGLT